MKLNQPFLLRTGLSAAFAALAFYLWRSLPQRSHKRNGLSIPSTPRLVSQGVYPMGNLVADGAGNLYGTTQEGGSSRELGNRL